MTDAEIRVCEQSQKIGLAVLSANGSVVSDSFLNLFERIPIRLHMHSTQKKLRTHNHLRVPQVQTHVAVPLLRRVGIAPQQLP